MIYKRKGEMQRLINEAKVLMNNDVLSIRDQKEIETAVETYFTSRQKILEDSLFFLKDDSKTADQQRYRWETHMNSKSSEAFRALADLLKYKNSSPLKTVVTEMISQESIFFLKLANLQFCDVMYARLIEYRKKFEEEKRSLKDKWNSLQSEGQNINTSIDENSKKIMELYKDVIRKAGNLKDNLRNNMKTYLTLLSLPGKVIKEIAIPNEVKQVITEIARAINSFMPSAKELAYRFDQLYKSEDNVAVIMFGNTRKSVQEFLEKTNLDKGQRDYYEAHKHARDVAANMLTSGQKEDAEIFVNIAEELTRKPLTSFTDAYNGFVNDFKEIFIGPVGDRTVRDLIKKERWDVNKEEWRRMNIQTELKRIYDDTREWINVDLYELTPEVKASIKASLKEEMDRLDLALGQAGDRSIFDAVSLYLSIVKETTFSRVKNT